MKKDSLTIPDFNQKVKLNHDPRRNKKAQNSANQNHRIKNPSIFTALFEIRHRQQPDRQPNRKPAQNDTKIQRIRKFQPKRPRQNTQKQLQQKHTVALRILFEATPIQPRAILRVSSRFSLLIFAHIAYDYNKKFTFWQIQLFSLF